uniref:Uncharacterized protein n=1 Tax=Anguilla anguilla TaxID=7936 RepID=A0A0E9QH56_ANGAN
MVKTFIWHFNYINYNNKNKKNCNTTLKQFDNDNSKCCGLSQVARITGIVGPNNNLMNMRKRKV